MTNWFTRNQNLIIKFAFLIPIISVATISISHVVSWYDLANPISWAVYLSIAVEIAAMSAIAAASVKVKGFSVWFVFIIVTFIQFIGNIYFSYTEINEASKFFKQWVELTSPVMDSLGVDITDIIAQKRALALLEGGLLPLISLTCLHFFIQYEGKPKEAIEIAKEIEELQDELEERLEEDELEEAILEEQIAENDEKSEDLTELVIETKPKTRPNPNGRGTIVEDYKRPIRKPGSHTDRRIW
jgi:hypothetical protein